jgi:hypothetical protein
MAMARQFVRPLPAGFRRNHFPKEVIALIL